ncbi:MAG: hypothetical protein H7259_03715, partial [Cytophagales bacterium]|nr:hypothetical protein [Cytophaga sp.]
NPRVVMAGVQHFLGVQPKPIVSLLVRQNPEKLHELIEEYAILKEGFKGTAYEGFFE